MRTQPISTVGRALRRRLWLILLLTVAGGVAAREAAMVRPAVYEATAVVSIDEGGAASQGVDVAMQADQFLAQRFIALGTSRQVLQAVCAKERRGCDPAALARQVRVTTPKATAQLAIVADASSPATAARLANEVADALIAANRAQAGRSWAPSGRTCRTSSSSRATSSAWRSSRWPRTMRPPARTRLGSRRSPSCRPSTRARISACRTSTCGGRSRTTCSRSSSGPSRSRRRSIPTRPDTSRSAWSPASSPACSPPWLPATGGGGAGTAGPRRSWWSRTPQTARASPVPGTAPT